MSRYVYAQRKVDPNKTLNILSGWFLNMATINNLILNQNQIKELKGPGTDYSWSFSS
ncbi:MAG: hypothetical protein NTV37_10575 [Proteobacteria bacterium]|nr:hypothetical protein [Pseudomonadota bacterium]